MLEEIKKLRRKGLSFRKIADELDTTVGKVQYRWKKYKELEEGKEENNLNTNLSTSTTTLQSIRSRYWNNKRLVPSEHLTAWLVSKNKLFVFWKLLDVKQNLVSSYFDKSIEDYQKVLRIYDVTHILFNGTNAHNVQEININEGQTVSLLDKLEANRCYITELGIKLSDHDFFPLLRSNTVHIPRTSKNQKSNMKKEIDLFLTKENTIPNWVEHVSTYSYYEKIKRADI